jgi:cytochrome P450
MNERYWGDPLSYRPERWIEEPSLKKAKFFIPFASGPRVCVGRNLATVEARLALARLFQKFKVLPASDDTPVEWTEHNHITMSPSSYKVRFVSVR